MLDVAKDDVQIRVGRFVDFGRVDDQQDLIRTAYVSARRERQRERERAHAFRSTESDPVDALDFDEP